MISGRAMPPGRLSAALVRPEARPQVRGVLVAQRAQQPTRRTHVRLQLAVQARAAAAPPQTPGCALWRAMRVRSELGSPRERSSVWCCQRSRGNKFIKELRDPKVDESACEAWSDPCKRVDTLTSRPLDTRRVGAGPREGAVPGGARAARAAARTAAKPNANSGGQPLAVLMLSMGITLTVADFKRVLKRFGAATLGFAGCYVTMPALAYGLARAFRLRHELTAGLVVVGAVNGGQASNLCTLIASGDVALSIMMTTTTTLGAIAMTPLLSKMVIGAVVPVNAVGIAFSTVQVVLAPIAWSRARSRLRYCLSSHPSWAHVAAVWRNAQLCDVQRTRRLCHDARR